MLLVGLTGGIASGKSTVSAMLSERGASVIDADQIAREVVMPGTTAWFKIRRYFGDGILFDDGFIDRQALGDIVFSDPRKLAVLNELTHPAIFKQVADRLERLGQTDAIVVLDAALLFESGLVDGVDLVVVVHAPREIQIERLGGKGMSARQASARIKAQLEPEVRTKGADVVIHNDGTLEDLTRQVDELWDDLQRRLRAKAARERGSGRS